MTKTNDVMKRPAPWSVSDQYILDAQGFAVCKWSPYCYMETALVLKAAPDLLEALEELLEQIDDSGIRDSSWAEALCRNRARVAIAKATT